MDLGLHDWTVLVTGASGGIGRATARALAAEGARLVLHGSSSFDTLEAWVAQQSFADRTLCVRADVTDPAALEDAFARARERFGRVDGCIANAGVWPPEDVPLHAMDEARARRTIEVDLLGALWTARAFGRSLQHSGPRPDATGASLLFTGSTAGRFGERGHADYAAAKAGLRGLALSLKNELVTLDPHARVNIVDPGWTVTEMTRKGLDTPGTASSVTRTMALRQVARAEDIARALVLLTSPRASRHVSGESLLVAGGMEGRVLWEREDIDESAVRARLAPDT